MSTMSERDLIDQLCALRPAWSARRDEIHEEHLYYRDAADFANEVVDAVLAGTDEPWIREACAVIERTLEVGTHDAQTLVVTGMLEAMQNNLARRDAAPNAMSDSLGPRTRAAWAELIAFWNGA